MMRPEDILSPCQGPLEIADCQIRGGGRVLGTWIPEQRRIQGDWSAMGVDAVLAARGHGEAQIFDRWAAERLADLAHVAPAGANGMGYGLDAWLRACPALRAAEATAGCSRWSAAPTSRCAGPNGGHSRA